MKKLIPFFVALLAWCSGGLNAQSVPQGIHYQTIVRGATNVPLTDTEVTLLFQIRDGAGLLLYSEKQTKMTNSNGLINLIVGQGVVQVGNFQNLDWSTGPRTLTVSFETSLNVFDEIGTMQLMSVPYALYAARSKAATSAATLDDQGAQDGQILKWNGTAWAPADDNTGDNHYAAGAGIDITGTAPDFTIINSGDTNAANDLLITDQANGDLSGIFSNLQIKADVVTSNEIAANAVHTSEIANKAVTYAKLDDTGASNGKILKYNGTAWVLADDNMGGNGNSYTEGAGIDITGTAPDFTIINSGDTDAANDLLITDQANGDVSGIFSNLQLKADVVTASEIANNSVGTTELLNGAVTYAKLDNTGASNGKVLKYNGTAWAPADDNTGVNGNSYAEGAGIDITGTAPNFTIINLGDIDGTNDVLVTDQADGDVSGTFSNLQLKADVVTANEIATDAVGSSEIASGVVGTAELANGAVTYAKLDNTGATNGKVLKYNGTAWAPADDNTGVNGNNYTAGAGINITGTAPDLTIINLGDIDGTNDVLVTDQANGDVSGTFSNLQIKANAVTSAEMATDAVTNIKMADNAVGTNELMNGAVTAAKLHQMNATPNQLLQWNGTAWAPATVTGDGFELCGQAIPSNVGIGKCPGGSTRLDVSNTTNNVDKTGVGIDINGAGANKGLLVVVGNGSNENDGVIALAYNGANNNIGMKIVAGGNQIPTFNTPQNYGLFAEVKDRQGLTRGALIPGGNADVGIYATVDDESEDYAAFFDGDLGILHEAEFINRDNGHQWSLFISRGGGGSGNCAYSFDDFIFNFQGSIKGVINKSTGNYCETSDIRLKEHVMDLSNMLQKTGQLRPVTYNFKSDAEKRPTLGFIAQEVEPLFPDLVHHIADADGQDLLTLNYSGFSVIAIKAIQEQQQIIETQQTQLTRQESRLAALEKEMAELRAIVKISVSGSHTGEK